jgi:hypothetical protein
MQAQGIPGNPEGHRRSAGIAVSGIVGFFSDRSADIPGTTCRTSTGGIGPSTDMQRMDFTRSPDHLLENGCIIQ